MFAGEMEPAFWTRDVGHHTRHLTGMEDREGPLGPRGEPPLMGNALLKFRPQKRERGLPERLASGARSVEIQAE